MLYIVSFSSIAVFPLFPVFVVLVPLSVCLEHCQLCDNTKKIVWPTSKQQKNETVYSEEILFLPACVRVCQENLMRETNTRCLSY